MITHVHARVPLHAGVQKNGLVPALTGITAISKPVHLKTNVRYFLFKGQIRTEMGFYFGRSLAGRRPAGRRRAVVVGVETPPSVGPCFRRIFISRAI